MKRRILTEIAWLFGLLVLAILLFLFVPGIAPNDINLHDTFVLSNHRAYTISVCAYLETIYLLLIFVTYLIRLIRCKFEIIPAVVVFLAVTGLMIYNFNYSVVIYRVYSEPTDDFFRGSSQYKDNQVVYDLIKISLMSVFVYTAL